MKKTLKRKKSTTIDDDGDDETNSSEETFATSAKKMKQSSTAPVKQRVKLTKNETVLAQRTSDDYETMPLDMKLMLEQNCCKEHDVIWDPFVCKGFAESYMRHLGYKIHSAIENKVEPIQSMSASATTSSKYVDFFDLTQPPPGVTMIVTNPPYSKKREVLKRLLEFDLPFVTILPSDVLQRDYYSNVVSASIASHHWSVLVPNKTISFHLQGKVERLARFKSAFFACRPLTSSMQRNNCKRCQTLCNNGVANNERTLHDVKIQLFDYAKFRRDNSGDEANNRPFHVSGPNIGQSLSLE